jgi:DNA-binding response OmpR family regulator
MPDAQPPTICDTSTAEILAVRRAEVQKGTVQDERVAGRRSNPRKLARETIWLSTIEYRILSFLAAKPYRAFTRHRIVEAISTSSQPVTPETLGHHIASLRDKLGVFADYIQSVPHIGYRFKE